MTSRTRYVVISSALVLFVGLGSGLVAYYSGFQARAFSSAGGPEELQYVPHDAVVVAYADVRHLMGSQLRQRIRDANPNAGPLAGGDGQRAFENQTGINIETDIDHVVATLVGDPAVGAGPGAGMVLARGTFNEVKIEALMRDHGARVESYKDKRLIVATPRGDNAVDANPSAAGSPEKELTLCFLKPGLVAIGTSNLIRRAIDLENGGDNVASNEELMNLVRALDSGNAWAVGRFDALRASTKLPAGMSQLPPITWFSATANINDGIDGVLRAEANSDEAAKNFRDVVQGFIALASLQGSSKPEVKAVVQSLALSGTGKTVALSFSIPGRIVDALGPTADRKSAAH